MRRDPAQAFREGICLRCDSVPPTGQMCPFCGSGFGCCGESAENHHLRCKVLDRAVGKRRNQTS